MPTTIPTINPYTGQVAVPGQPQATFTFNMQSQLTYEANLAPDLNATVAAMNTVSGEVETLRDEAQTSADDAETSAVAAQGYSNFQGAWSSATGAWNKGNSFDHTGRTWALLVDLSDITTVEPGTDENSWRAVLSDDFGVVTGGNFDEVKLRRGTNAEILAGTPAIGEAWFNKDDRNIHMGDGSTLGGVPHLNTNLGQLVYKETGVSAVDNMIDGVPFPTKVGNKCVTGGTVWKRVSDSAGDITDFKPLTKVYASDFGMTRDAIQRALNIGGKVWCKSGAYVFASDDDPLEIPEGAWLVGESEKTTVFDGSALVGPFIKNESNRYLDSVIEGIRFEGNLSSSTNEGIVIERGARHLVIRKNRFINMGSHCIHFNSGILGSGGFGSYYNTITENTFGDALSSSVLVNGRALYVEGTANQNEFSWNSIRNTYLEGIRFDAISGNNFQCQNWDIYGNGIEGCGRTNSSEMAGIYLGDLTSNINIIMNYFERNGSDTAGGADVLANSPTTGIGTANVCRNLFAQSQHNIRCREYSGMNVHNNWRSGSVGNGGVYFFRVDSWNGITGKHKFDLQGNQTHESCDIPFMQGAGLSGYPNSRGVSGEIASNNSVVTPDLQTDGYVKRQFNGDTTLFKTDDGAALVVENNSGDVGSLFISGGSILGIKSEGVELYLENATKRIQFGDSTFRPATAYDSQVDLGLGTARYRDLYVQNAPTVGSDIRYKKNVVSIPQELIDFALNQEIYQYQLVDGNSGRNHYGVVVTPDFISKLNAIYAVEDCAALCYTLFVDEDGNPALDTPDLDDENGRWQVRYDEWQNILLEGLRRSVL